MHLPLSKSVSRRKPPSCKAVYTRWSSPFIPFVVVHTTLWLFATDSVFGLPRSTVSRVVNEVLTMTWRFAVALPTASSSTGRFQMQQRRTAAGLGRLQVMFIRINIPMIAFGPAV
jgi:hypothetical protein